MTDTPTPAGAMTGRNAFALFVSLDTALSDMPEWDSLSLKVQATWDQLAVEISRRAVSAEFIERTEVHQVPPDMANEMGAFMDNANQILVETNVALTTERARSAKLREALEELQAEYDSRGALLEAANGLINKIDPKAFRKLAKVRPVMPTRRTKA